VTTSVTWRSSDTATATIDADGVMTAVQGGLAAVDATLDGVTSNPVNVRVVNEATLQSISIYEEGTDRKLFIDPNECIDCGACEPECPVNAIFPEESLPPEWANYTAIDATWFTDKAAARAAVDELKPR